MNPDGSRDDPTSDYEPSVDASEFTSVSTARLRHLYENGRYATAPLFARPWTPK